jgi:large subunit ribosomal protein L25
MATTTIEVERREQRGSNAARRMRAEGRVPGNVYGMNLEPFAVSVSGKRIREVLQLATGRNTILTLSMAGADQKREVMMRELQRDPVTGRVMHVDFERIDPDVALTVTVPVRLVGTPEGVKNEGGVIDFVQRQIEVSCLPGSIPEQLDVNVEPLHINQNVSVADLQVGEGVTVLDDPEAIIAVVSAPRAIVEEVPEEEAEAEGEAPEEGAATEAGEAEKEAGGSGD